jgi:hypothetical protein
MTTKPLVVYLDQNKWIDLARAYHNRPDGTRYKSTLEMIQSSVSEGKAILPLYATHVIETRKSADPSRRRRLSQVMAHISRGWTIAPKYLIMLHELEICIAETFGHSPPAPPVVFGRGIPFAFGLKTALRDRSGAEVDTPEALAQQVDKFLLSADVVEWFLIGIDEPNNLAAIKKYEQSQSALVNREEEFRSKARPHGHSIHKRAYAANLTLAIQSELIRLLASYGLAAKDFLDLGQDRLMAFFANVPTLDVEIELVIGRNEHWDKQIHGNDPADIEFLSVAIPYCDTVVTEGFWCHLAQESKLDQKYRTVILSDLTELEARLG